jgi:putative ABC transport system substrate-binding protein
LCGLACRAGADARTAVVGEQSEFAKAGALFCYGADLDLFRQLRAEEVIE